MTILHSVHMVRTLRRAAQFLPALLHPMAACQRLLRLCVLALVMAGPALAQNISNVAGTGYSGFMGDGGPAADARLNRPVGVAVDAAGNIYIAEAYNYRIRKVNAAGIITTVAGNGTSGFSGDGGLATAAQLGTLISIAVDAAGNLYISDVDNNRVRKVDTSGVISTVAGDGTSGHGGDGGQATAAKVGVPLGVAVDAAGNLYIATYGRVRKVDSTGVITTVAGNGAYGSGGDGGQATAAQLGYAAGLTVDAAGNLFIVDDRFNTVRKVDSTGVISTVAGNGTSGYSGDGGPATAAQLFWANSVAVDSAGTLYIADAGNHRIRKVDSTGTISTLVGDGARGSNGDGGPATAARANYPSGVAVDAADNLFIADSLNYRVRKVSDVPPDAPTAVTAVASNAQATVSWTAPAYAGGRPITSYTVTAVQDSTRTCAPAPATATTCTVTGLANGTGYTFTVVASNSVGAGTASAPSTEVTPATIPGAPTAVSAVAGNAQASVSWTAPASTGGSPITSYTVASVQDSGKTCTPAPATATGCTVVGLANGSAYTFTVVASNRLGAGTTSAPSTGVTPATIPGAPTGVSAVAGDAQAAVIWTPPASTGGSPVTSYNVTAVQDSTKTCTPAPATATGCTVAGLVNGSAYSFTVVASNSRGAGTASTPSTLVRPASVPGAVTVVSTVAGNTQVTVSWTAPANDGGRPITGYTVAAVQDGTKTCTPVPATATTCTVAGLANGTGYTFTVVASNSLGAGTASAPGTVVTPATAPGIPTGVNAVAGNGQATVNWTAPTSTGGSPITSYTVAAVEDGTKTCTPAPATATSCTIPGLTNGSGYTFTVVASNTAGPGTASAPSMVVTPVGPPDAPTAVTAVAANAQATVSWTAPVSNGGSAITSYTVTGIPAGTCTVAAPATICAVPGLANGTAHTFAVVASNALWSSAASVSSTSVVPAVPSAPDPGPVNLSITAPGITTTIADPGRPIVIGPDATGGTIVLPGAGSMPVGLQIGINGQPLPVQVLPGSHLRIAKVPGQNVLVLEVVQGWASMTSSAVDQPMALAGSVVLSSGAAGTRIEAQPLTVAVLTGSLVPPAGSLSQLGSMGLQAGERLQVNAQGAIVSITLGSLNGTTSQPGDAMAFANLPAAISVDGTAFARLSGQVTRLSGANLAQGLEVVPSGVFLLRDGGQIFQLLPTLPITIDATLPDGAAFTPLGLLRWVRGGVVVQFAPAVADLAGLANALVAALPGASLKLGAEGVLQLTLSGQTYVLRPDWTGAGMAAGTPQVRVDEQGRIVFQLGNGPGQLLLPALLSATQANAIITTAIPGATLAVQPGVSDGALTLTLADQQWRLVPQWLLTGNDAAQTAPWRMGSDGVLYLRLGTQVQGVRVAD